MAPDGASGPTEVVRRTLAATSADPGLEERDATLQRLCRAATTALDLSGAAIHLSTVSGDWGVAAAADEASARAAELSFTMGEGPSLDAFGLRRPVLVSDLENGRRWSGFTQAALDVGVRSVFSFPLQIGGVRLGTLDLYADTRRELTEEDAVLALAFSTAVTQTLLGIQLAEDGAWEPTLVERAEIHQAQGMVMVDLGIGLAEALVRMRAHAFAHGVPLVELARTIIAGAHLPAAHAGPE